MVLHFFWRFVLPAVSGGGATYVFLTRQYAATNTQALTATVAIIFIVFAGKLWLTYSREEPPDLD